MHSFAPNKQKNIQVNGHTSPLSQPHTPNQEMPGAPPDSFALVERAKQEWECTVDALPDLICVVDGDGRVLRTNRTIEEWGLGSVLDVTGCDLHKRIHPVCARSCYLDSFMRQARQTMTNNHNNIIERYDPLLQRYIEMRSRPVVMKNATTEPRWVIILRDITKRKKMEQALHQQNGRLAAINTINQTILKAQSPQEIAQTTLTHLQSLIPFQQAHILLHLPQTHKLLVLATAGDDANHCLQPGEKRPFADFTGNDVHHLSHFFMAEMVHTFPHPTPMEQQWQRQNIGAYANFPLVMGRRLIGALQLATNDPPAFKPEHIIIVRQVAETLTIAINQSQLYQKLEQGNQELQALLRDKHEMMQNVSHDLRSPLALIKGYTELLQDGLFGDLTAEQQEALTILDTNGDQLFFLINRLFNLQTIDKHSLDKKRIAPQDFLVQVAQSWHVLTTNKSVHLHLALPPELPTIPADANMLNQVMSNLLDNALKFSPAGSAITLSAQAQGNDMIIVVQDEGQGIPQEQLKKIFDRFYQVDKDSPQAKAGAGIGLALCKAIVEAHDGRLWAESAGTGQGSAFYVSLPINSA